MALPCGSSSMLQQTRFLFSCLVIYGSLGFFTDLSIAASRPFVFGSDSIAFRNELKWEYGFDPNGRWSGHKRNPPAEYALHCFVLARTAAQFYQFAEFHPELPKTNSNGYQALIRQISKRNLRGCRTGTVAIPGYTNLYQFSAEQAKVIKAGAGSARQSYFQRGNWRMVFPFTRGNQERTAARLAAAIQKQGEAVVHVVRFPKLDLNHAVLLHAVQERPDTVVFSFYDPNAPEEPRALIFDRKKRQFIFPRTNYFRGGPVNLYRIYSSWCY
jgi:hypothetical protein